MSTTVEEKPETVDRYIKKGKNTKKHMELLRAKGYEVEEQEKFICVKASEVVEGEVDFSSPEKTTEVITNMIKEKQVFSYQTVFDFGDKKLKGILACGRLGLISSLVTKARVRVKKINANDAIFAAI